MYDIKNMNIWKPVTGEDTTPDGYYMTDISELNLSVRSYNCLKRAGCSSVGDVIGLLNEDGTGLRKIRNLGSRSEAEILSNIDKYKKDFMADEESAGGKPKRKIIKPAKRAWDEDIEAFHLSEYALTRLKKCGINQVKDLYATNPKREPGWYAVRELFEKIPSTS